MVERCLFASGRPVLIAVFAVPAEPAEDGTIVVAWDGSAEAARAFSDARPFVTAKRAAPAAAREDSLGDASAPADGMIAHLARHGVDAEALRVPLSEERRYRTAADGPCKGVPGGHGRDGAFHHSRWRELILGGVTLTMLEEAAIPLFMAH